MDREEYISAFNVKEGSLRKDFVFKYCKYKNRNINDLNNLILSRMGAKHNYYNKLIEYFEREFNITKVYKNGKLIKLI